MNNKVDWIIAILVMKTNNNTRFRNKAHDDQILL